jgi:hypothetical protein
MAACIVTTDDLPHHALLNLNISLLRLSQGISSKTFLLTARNMTFKNTSALPCLGLPQQFALPRSIQLLQSITGLIRYAQTHRNWLRMAAILSASQHYRSAIRGNWIF